MGALIPPGWPDTAQIRKEWAGYFNDVTAVDHWVWKMLDELETGGLTDNTIVIIWSDHGRNAPNVRAKRHVYDAGIHIPLIVHVPEQYRDHLAPPGYTPGGKTDRLVSTMDLAPSVLKLAGVEVPAYMQGRAFMGPDPGEPREYVYAARDRADETYDITRVVRSKKFKYIRHYEPWKPYDQHIETKFRVSRAYSELRRLKKKGKLSPEAARYLREHKPMEELYDLEADPRETENLANDPEYQVTLQKLRAAHRRWMHRTRDLGLVPESLMKQLSDQYGTLHEIFHQSGGLERFMSVRQAAITATRGPFARSRMVNLFSGTIRSSATGLRSDWEIYDQKPVLLSPHSGTLWTIQGPV